METNYRDDFDAACRPCDACGILLLPGESVSPPGMAEATCVLCLPIVQAEIDDETARIPVEPMAAVVNGRLR